MPYRICKTIEIQTGHILTKHPAKCKFPHGHSRQVEIILEADRLDRNEMVCDFKVVKDAIKDFVDTLDHSLCVNTDDPMYRTLSEAYGERVIPFASTDPTTEVLAKLIHDKVREALTTYAQAGHSDFPLRQEVRVVRVRVRETSTSWAEYAE